MKLSAFIETYFDIHVDVNNKPSTAVAKRQILRTTVLPILGERPLGEISKADILVFKARCAKLGLSGKTVNNHLTVLRNILVVAEEMELIETVPKIKRVKVVPSKKRALSPAELSVLLEAAEEPWRSYIELVSLTGLRIGELRALQWSHIRTRATPPEIDVLQTCVGKWNYIGKPKGADRSVPLNRRALALTKQLNRHHEFVMALPLLPEAPLSYKRCGGAITRARKAAGIDWFVGWHTLRHTFASNLADASISLQKIQALLGHTDISTTAKYTHINHDELVLAVQVLDKA